MTIKFDEATTRLVRDASTQPIVSRTVKLTVTAGRDQGKTLSVDDLAERQLFVGKSPTCDLRLDDPAVSRRHLSLELAPDGRGLVLRDLDSSNGTEVAGLLVREIVLRGGETVSLGGSAFRAELGDERILPGGDASSFGAFVGASPAARSLYPSLARFAASDVPVLLEGEAGTGKELLAVALHEAGARKAGPFVVFERGPLAAPLAEAALFGQDGVAGLLERASGGTFFVHDIGDLELPLQAKLLDALERRVVRRIGAATPTPIDVRFIASTSRDLEREVQEHRFREDLLAFMSTARVVVPPLRRRRADVAILTQLFWNQFGGKPGELSPSLIQQFEQRSWQGNVRELAKAVASHLAAAELVPHRATAEAEAAPAPPSLDVIDEVLKRGLAFTRAREIVTAEFEHRYLEHMLALHKGNVSRAAAASGISRRYFYRLRSRD